MVDAKSNIIHPILPKIIILNNLLLLLFWSSEIVDSIFYMDFKISVIDGGNLSNLYHGDIFYKESLVISNFVITEANALVFDSEQSFFEVFDKVRALFVQNAFKCLFWFYFHLIYKL